MANIGRGYSWSNNKYDNYRCVIQDPPKHREYQELCSINTIKDNPKLLENIPSQTNIYWGSVSMFASPNYPQA